MARGAAWILSPGANQERLVRPEMFQYPLADPNGFEIWLVKWQLHGDANSFVGLELIIGLQNMGDLVCQIYNF